ncbi:hypothetical protein F511_14904 [Dorcoceras hygrometricum]|uniref:Helicase domain-containing family protein n=1 Tax=Dorcoceras hygrometricum TaxID=472368 RepID=A0A2Z7BCR5_9LAMI|nr:hypothetical protein F511_14904 [Dorcoceras hygrometricum]
MVVDLIGIYGLKGPYCTLTTTNWFLQALSVIPRRSWGDVARRSYHDPMGSLLVQADWREIDSGRGPDWRYLPQSIVKCRFLYETGRSQAQVPAR